MNSFLICFALFVNIFPLKTEGTASVQYTPQFGKFLSKYINCAGILSIAEVEDYHSNDRQGWNDDSVDDGANSGLFGNRRFLRSVRAVIRESLSNIEKAITQTENKQWAYELVGGDLPCCLIPGVAVAVPFVLARLEALPGKTARLKQLTMYLNRHYVDNKSCSVRKLVTAVFRIIIYEKTNGEKEQLTLEEFFLFMTENPTEKHSLPFLIHTAFKEYMLGMISRGPNREITKDGFEDFLKIRCGLDGDISGNFKYFAEAMGSAGQDVVQLSAVRQNWADKNVASAFNTLVKN